MKNKLFRTGRLLQLFVNQNKHNGNSQKASPDISAIYKFIYLFQSHFFSSKLVAKYKNTIQKTLLSVKSNNDSETKAKPKNPAETLPQNEANTFLNRGEILKFLINNTLPNYAQSIQTNRRIVNI